MHHITATFEVHVITLLSLCHYQAEAKIEIKTHKAPSNKHFFGLDTKKRVYIHQT